MLDDPTGRIVTVEDFKEVLGEMFSNIEEKRLEKLHPDLVAVVRLAKAMGGQFRVGETVRSLEAQRRNVASGVSWTLNSRHLPSKDGLARAVDLHCVVDGKITWSWAPYYKLAKIVKAAAKASTIPVIWGGDWKTVKDGPHWELPRNKYP